MENESENESRTVVVCKQTGGEKKMKVQGWDLSCGHTHCHLQTLFIEHSMLKNELL
jgi:hypothetical protein